MWPLPLSSKCITLPYASSDTLPSSCPFYEDSCDYGRCTRDRHLDNSGYSSHFKIRNRTCTFPLAIEGNVPRFLGQGYGRIWGPLFSPPQRVWIVRREKWFCHGLLSLLLLKVNASSGSGLRHLCFPTSQHSASTPVTQPAL